MINLSTKIKKTSDLRKIFELSLPVMLGMILQSLLSTVDMIFISKLGTNVLTAASFGVTTNGVILVISTLVSAGTIALVTRSYGEGNMELVKKYSSESYLLSAIIGGAISVIGYLNTMPLIKLMFNPEPEILDLSYRYMSILILGTVFVFLNSALRTIMQALGDTKTPLYIFGASNIVNMLVAPVLIFIFNLGIEGAGLATVISTIFSFITINYILIKRLYNNSLKNFLSTMKLKLSTSMEILRIGGWACIQQLARPLTGLIMVRLVYRVGGTEGSAAFGTGSQLFNYTFIFLVGLSTAIAITVGQSIGRKDINGCENLINEGMKLAILNMLLFSIPYLIFPREIMLLFTNDTNVIKVGIEYFRIVYFGIIFAIFPTIYGGAFQGAGDTFYLMISSIIANVVFKLLAAYSLGVMLNMGTNGVWIAIALSSVVEAAIITYYFKKGKWKAHLDLYLAV